MCRSATLGLTGWLQDTQKICRSVSSPSPSATWTERQTALSDRQTGEPPSLCPPPRSPVSHLLVLLDLLLFGVGDDGLQLVEAFLHQREAEPRRLLLLPDSLQLSPPHLLGHAGTLLPLLDPLGEDLVDTTGGRMQPIRLRGCGVAWRGASAWFSTDL